MLGCALTGGALELVLVPSNLAVQLAQVRGCAGPPRYKRINCAEGLAGAWAMAMSARAPCREPPFCEGDDEMMR